MISGELTRRVRNAVPINRAVTNHLCASGTGHEQSLAHDSFAVICSRFGVIDMLNLVALNHRQERSVPIDCLNSNKHYVSYSTHIFDT